ncbi:MAG: hypothetical protein KDK36_12210, partial [Leptospiraceae bacterium]|nr:hypothetical protein [Leptospiraceae bacterium]
MYSIHSCNLNIPEKEKISLYFKSNEDIFQKDKGILIKNPSVIDFGTLFSSFSIGKWIKFTNLKSIFIEIYSKGEIELELFYKKSSESNSEILNKFKFNGSFSEEIQFPKDSLQESIIWFKIITLEKDVTIESISYKSPILPLNKIKLGIVFTTYNREEYIKNNISKTSIIPDQIKEDLTIIVVDNAKTLNKEDFNNIHLIPNKNMGGAG